MASSTRTAAPHEVDPAAEARKARWALAVLVGLTFGSLRWLSSPFYDPTLFTGDGAIYLITARSLLAGEGYSYLGDPFIIRPPGFSVLLLPLLVLGGVDTTILTWFVNCTGVLCVALVFLYQRARLGNLVALAVSVAIWLNPGFQTLSNQIMSDVPGAALMLLCLLLERWASRNPAPSRDWVLGVAIAAATYVRTINVLLVPAVVLARVLRARRCGAASTPSSFVLRRLLLVCVVPIALLAPWGLRNALVASPERSDHTLLHSYAVAMVHRDISDPGSPRISWAQFLERVERQVDDLALVLGSRMKASEHEGPDRWLALAAVGCLAIVLWRKRGTGDVLTVGLLAVLSTYFSFLDRLVLPIYLMLLPAVAYVVLLGLRWRASQRTSAWIAALLVLGVACLDFDPRRGWEAAQRREAELAYVCEYVRKEIPPQARLAADFGGHFSLELDRPVYNLRWVLHHRGVRGARRFLEKYDIDVVIADRRLRKRLLADDEVVAELGRYSIVRIER